MFDELVLTRSLGQRVDPYLHALARSFPVQNVRWRGVLSTLVLEHAGKAMCAAPPERKRVQRCACDLEPASILNVQNWVVRADCRT